MYVRLILSECRSCCGFTGDIARLLLWMCVRTALGSWTAGLQPQAGCFADSKHKTCDFKKTSSFADRTPAERETVAMVSRSVLSALDHESTYPHFLPPSILPDSRGAPISALLQPQDLFNNRPILHADPHEATSSRTTRTV